MKKITKLIGVFALTTFFAFSSPALIAQDTNTVTERRIDDDVDEEDDDTGKWGLLGLLGLAGLLGLKRRDDDRNRGTTTTTHR